MIYFAWGVAAFMAAVALRYQLQTRELEEWIDEIIAELKEEAPDETIRGTVDKMK